MTPEEHLEARAEQLVERMARERRRHEFVADARTSAHRCACGDWTVDKGSGDRGAWVQWHRHVERAALNVVLTEREQITCPTCKGTGEDPTAVALEKLSAVLDLRCYPCKGSGSVPDELLVVGLIGGEG